ncbi:MAG TPA: class I SAM-dependent methyltransferase [Kofleriaceae bacterium]|nr:class I SAM-dependent methyltransferase [Kofleriaceae bacterium]
MTPRRYQLRKDAAAIVRGGHPWLFRDQMSSAAGAFRDGAWLRLVDGDNHVVGYGMYEAEGAIAIRVLRVGDAPPDAAWLRERLAAAAARRAELVRTTDGVRLVHGESDGIPAVVADRFGDTLVVSSYAAGADALARYVAHAAHQPNVVLRPARRRHSAPPPPRVVRGAPPEVAHFSEDGTRYAVDLAAGHKTGTYLDLRGLRRAIAGAPLAGARVLNLFAYTGMLGRAAEAAGAAHVVQVDASERALAFAAAHHVIDPARHRFVTADVFAWLPQLDRAETFDLVIADPPAMTSRRTQVGHALAAYRRLYRAAAEHVRPGGALVAACCTSRIERAVFRRTVQDALGNRFALAQELPPEPDHPVGFPQADYLKILWWRCTRAAQS